MNNFHDDVVSAIAAIERRRSADRENLYELYSYLETGTGRGGGVGVERSDDHLTVTYWGRPLLDVCMDEGKWLVYGVAGVDRQLITALDEAKKSIAAIVASAIDGEQETRRS